MALSQPHQCCLGSVALHSVRHAVDSYIMFISRLLLHPPRCLSAAAVQQELASAGLLATPDCPNPARFEWQTLGKLSYLQACIREGLRLFSPAANGSWRLSAHADIQISPDITLPKVCLRSKRVRWSSNESAGWGGVCNSHTNPSDQNSNRMQR